MDCIITLKQVSKKYGSFAALEDINAQWEGRRTIALVGPNGAGKSTLIKILAHSIKPTTGTAQINQTPVGFATHNRVAYMAATSNLYRGLKAKNHIRWYQDMFFAFDANKALSLCQKLGINVGAKISTFSKGEAKKLMLACTLAQTTQVYLLDEPFEGLDPKSKHIAKTLVVKQAQEGAIVVIGTHLLKDVEDIVDQFVFMQNGKITASRLADAIREEEGMSVEEFYIKGMSM